MAAAVLDTRSLVPPSLERRVDARAAATASRDLLARARITLTYAWRHHRVPHLAEPVLFTEWIQHRKLHDRDPRLPRLADKLLVKAEVARVLGPEWVTPTLWHGTALPLSSTWPAPFVVKSRHGSNQTVFVRSPDVDWPALRHRTARWMSARYGVWLDEWLYGEIERGLLVEPFIGGAGALPIDYKLHVFAGRVAVVEVHLQRETAHRWLMLDRDWRPFDRHLDAPPRPRTLARMIEGAETLARDHDYVRVDLYEIAGNPRFGELTFYPGSGLHPIHPPSLDKTMGALWREARTRR
jgi:hypothetical protein